MTRQLGLGDEVYHKDEPKLSGVVVTLIEVGSELYFELTDEIDEPWVEIQWREVPEGESPYLGREHESQLVRRSQT